MNLTPVNLYASNVFEVFGVSNVRQKEIVNYFHHYIKAQYSKQRPIVLGTVYFEVSKFCQTAEELVVAVDYIAKWFVASEKILQSI